MNGEMTKEIVGTETPSREVIIVQTQGAFVTLTTGANTLGELKRVVREDNIDVNFSNMKIVNGENQHIYELDETILPAGAFTLFLMPIKNKSGAYVWEKLGFFPTRNYIKGIIAAHGAEAEAHFNTGQKWAKDKTDVLHAKLLSWEISQASRPVVTLTEVQPQVEYTTDKLEGTFIQDKVLIGELNRGVESGNLAVMQYAQEVAETLGLEINEPSVNVSELKEKYDAMRAKFSDVE